MASLKNELTEFKNVNVIQIMYYLYTSYGKVDGIKLEKNQVTMMTVYTSEPPMDILNWKRVEISHDLASSTSWMR